MFRVRIMIILRWYWLIIFFWSWFFDFIIYFILCWFIIRVRFIFKRRG